MANERDLNSLDGHYFAEFDSESRMVNIYFYRVFKSFKYFVEEFDYSKFFTFGSVKNKKLFLTEEETFYLNQVGLIKLKEGDEMENLNVVDNFLFSYLRRAGKIITW